MREKEKEKGMIENDRQLEITKKQLIGLEKGLEDAQKAPDPPHIHPLLMQAERDGLKSMINTLKGQIAEYEGK